MKKRYGYLMFCIGSLLITESKAMPRYYMEASAVLDELSQSYLQQCPDEITKKDWKCFLYNLQKIVKSTLEKNLTTKEERSDCLRQAGQQATSVVDWFFQHFSFCYDTSAQRKAQIRSLMFDIQSAYVNRIVKSLILPLDSDTNEELMEDVIPSFNDMSEGEMESSHEADQGEMENTNNTGG